MNAAASGSPRAWPRSRSGRLSVVGAGIAVIAATFLPPNASAQSLVERTPQMSGGWTGQPGQIQFNLAHRFVSSGPPERKISAFPTFVLGVPVVRGLLAGLTYATNSNVVPTKPNELELFVRGAPLHMLYGGVQEHVQLGFNAGAGSVDAELGLSRSFGPVKLMAAGRAFTEPYDEDNARFAVGGGAVVRVLGGVALAADIATLTDRRSNEEVAWSVGVQLGVPYSPHSLGIHISNALTGTLQGTSRGTDRARIGFEFTVPITLARIFGPAASPVPAAAATPDAGTAGEDDVFYAELRNLAFAPGVLEVPAGATVVWVNGDNVVHTVTARDNSWGSTAIQPGGTFARTFTEPGRYAVYCIPHPFMVMEVVVR